MEKNRVIGLVILLVVMAAGLGYWYFSGQGGIAPLREEVTLRGLIGSEKNLILQSPRILDLMRRTHGLRWDFTREGSVEQVRPERIALAERDQPLDFLWPSSQVSLELFRLWNPGRSHQAEVLFNTPLVFFTWGPVVDALQRQGLLVQEEGALFLTGLDRLLEAVFQEREWKDIGLPQLYGKVNLISTDPTRSNSGNLFAGLLANLLAQGVAQEGDLARILPQLKQFFQRQGFMEHSTGFLFEQFLSRGMGSYPIIVGYEHQLVEFALSNPRIWEGVKDRIQIVYPVPTVWSSHTFIALTPRARAAFEAWKDPEVQALAWKEHGFRPAIPASLEAVDRLVVGGLARDITRIVPLPSAGVMLRITQALQDLTRPTQGGEEVNGKAKRSP